MVRSVGCGDEWDLDRTCGPLSRGRESMEPREGEVRFLAKLKLPSSEIGGRALNRGCLLQSHLTHFQFSLTSLLSRFLLPEVIFECLQQRNHHMLLVYLLIMTWTCGMPSCLSGPWGLSEDENHHFIFHASNAETMLEIWESCVCLCLCVCTCGF